ncbi:MAG: homocitrate synthase NifV [Hyphomicrobiaceae bacterium]|jgi:homocitrate synthase NifV
MPERLVDGMLVDNTLRESEQVTGVGFDAAARRRILARLAAAKVDLIDLGLPGDETHWRDIADMNASLPDSVTGAASVRARDNDLAAAANHGIRDVFVVFPASEIHIERKFGWTTDEFRRRVADTLDATAKYGLQTWVVAEDSSRGSQQLISSFAEQCTDQGAKALFLCDTVGTMTPSRVEEWLSPALSRSDALPIGVHCHNDFGMATANTIQAWDCGARLLSCTLNGLGERAGNADTLQVAAALMKLLGVSGHWDLAQLCDASRELEKESGIPLPIQAPLVGWTAFRHESGIHVDGMLKNPEVYEALDPADFGSTRAFTLGTSSGRAHIRHVLATWDVTADDDLINDLFWAVRELATTRTTSSRTHIDALYGALEGRCLEDKDLLALVDDLRRKAHA